MISEIYRDIVSPTFKPDGSPVTIADLAASKIIADYLQPTGIPILGEETEKADFEERINWTENWCVDPLDGTKMFLQRNGEFSVNIAHIVGAIVVGNLPTGPVVAFQNKIIAGFYRGGHGNIRVPAVVDAFVLIG